MPNRDALSHVREGRCPNCTVRGRLLPGPRGGASQNFYCARCQEGWNLHGVDYGGIAVDHLGRVNPTLIALYTQKAKP